MQVAKALARLRKGAESSELPLLAHAIKTTSIGSCETAQTRASFHYSRMQWIKTNVDCVSTSAECPCVLNANNKGSGEIVKWSDLF